MEAIRNICCTKGEDTIDHSIVTRWFKKFGPGCKNLNNQAWLGSPKSMDFDAVLKVNLVSSTERVSNKLGISQSSLSPS